MILMLITKENQDEMLCLSGMFQFTGCICHDQAEPGPSWHGSLDCFINPKQILLTVEHFPKHLFIHWFALVLTRLHSRLETYCKSPVTKRCQQLNNV